MWILKYIFELLLHISCICSAFSSRLFVLHVASRGRTHISGRSSFWCHNRILFPRTVWPTRPKLFLFMHARTLLLHHWRSPEREGWGDDRERGERRNGLLGDSKEPVRTHLLWHTNTATKKQKPETRSLLKQNWLLLFLKTDLVQNVFNNYSPNADLVWLSRNPNLWNQVHSFTRKFTLLLC